MVKKFIEFPKRPKTKPPKKAAKPGDLMRLSEIYKDGTLWLPAQLFQDSAQRAVIEYPKRTKAMAIFYDPAADHVNYSQCGMTLSEMIRMLARIHDELIFDLINACL